MAIATVLVVACMGSKDGTVAGNIAAISQTRSGALTRIFTTPSGSETTSPFYYRNLNGSGFDYMTAVVQHPYGEPENGDPAPPDADAVRAYAGYIGPFPTIAPQTAHSTDFADFAALPLANGGDRHLARSSERVNINGKTSTIAYHPMFRSGDNLRGAVWGQHVDVNGDVLRNYSATDYGTAVSTSPDHTTLLAKAGKIFSITQFEEGAGMMYVSELHQDPATGALTPLATKPVDLSPTYGGYTFCAGQPTPWGTHLGGEEYPVDANAFEKNGNVDPLFDPYLEYYGFDPKAADVAASRAAAYAQTSVYRVGYPVEVALTGTDIGSGRVAANAKAVKHYGMGRLAWELAHVMPDRKTVYAGDDGTNRGMFRFVADDPADLSAGTLYAAKLHQTSADNGGSFDVGWISLGPAGDLEIDTYIRQGVQFSDLFDQADVVGNACPAGFAPSEADGVAECLRLKLTNFVGMSAGEIRQAASRLEALRYAAMLGATHEFRKFEGVTYDPLRGKLYIAISDIGKAMTAAPTLAGLGDDIHVGANACGGVYQLSVDPATYVTMDMKALVLGTPDKRVAGNACDVDGIANPDNIVMGPTKDDLIIGEDTNLHRNDVLWSYKLPAL
ncbi:MAG: DUF839 domain-containing protein [Burkholderiaceae bacterium]